MNIDKTDLCGFCRECGIGDRRPRFDGAARRNRPPRPCGTIGRDGRDRHNGRNSAGIIREKHQIHRKKISKQRIHRCFLI